MLEGIESGKSQRANAVSPTVFPWFKSLPSHGGPVTEANRLGYRERRPVRRERMRKTASLGRLPSHRFSRRRSDSAGSVMTGTSGSNIVVQQNRVGQVENPLRYPDAQRRERDAVDWL